MKKTHRNRLLKAVRAVLKTSWWWLPVRNGLGKPDPSPGNKGGDKMTLKDHEVIFQLRTHWPKPAEFTENCKLIIWRWRIELKRVTDPHNSVLLRRTPATYEGGYGVKLQIKKKDRKALILTHYYLSVVTCWSRELPHPEAHHKVTFAILIEWHKPIFAITALLIEQSLKHTSKLQERIY